MPTPATYHWVEYDPATELLTLESDSDVDDGATAGPLDPEQRLRLVERLLTGTGYDIAPNGSIAHHRRPDRAPAPVLFGTDIIDPERVGALFANATARNRAMFALIGVYGLRPAEIVTLTVGDVDDDHRAVTTTAANGRRRRVRIHRDVAETLVAWEHERAALAGGLSSGFDPTDPASPVFMSLHTGQALETNSVASLVRKAGVAMGHDRLTSADVTRSCQWAMYHHPRFSRDSELFPPMATFMELAGQGGE